MEYVATRQVFGRGTRLLAAPSGREFLRRQIEETTTTSLSTTTELKKGVKEGGELLELLPP